MKRRRQKHLYYDKEWFIFPFAIGWFKNLLHSKPHSTAGIPFSVVALEVGF